MAEPRARGGAPPVTRFHDRLAAATAAGAFVLVLFTVGVVAFTAREASSWGAWSAVGVVCALAGGVMRRLLSHYYPPPPEDRRRRPAP